MTYNANRDPKRTEAMEPDDFNPFAKKRGGGEDIELPFDTLKIFVTNIPPK